MEGAFVDLEVVRLFALIILPSALTGLGDLRFSYADALAPINFSNCISYSIISKSCFLSR